MNSRTLAILALTVAATTAAQAGSVTVNLAPVNTQKLSNFSAPGGAVSSPIPYSPTDVTTACLSARCFSTYTDTRLDTVPFALAADYSSSSATNNIWASPNAGGDSSIVLNLGVGTAGIYNASSVWSLISSLYAVSGYNGLTVTFAGLDSGLSSVSESVNLLSGYDYRAYYNTAASNGAVDDCTVASPVAPTNSLCSTAGASGLAGQGAGVKDTSANYIAANIGSAVTTTVYANIWDQTSSNASVQYWFDAQRMDLGSMFLGGYLDSITITNHNGPAGPSNPQINKTLLAAVTVETVPEPGTSMMLLSGIGALVFGLRRRKV